MHYHLILTKTLQGMYYYSLNSKGEETELYGI